MPDGIREPDGEGAVERAVRGVLASMSGGLTARESALLGELSELGRTILRAKAEIAALSVHDITGGHIPSAADELDAIVAHTAHATNEILDSCEALEAIGGRLRGEDADALQRAVTRIYEASSFQDITGQRIGKVVAALKAIEAQVATVIARANGAVPVEDAASEASEGRRLAEGPQLPHAARSQSDVDRLLASFD